MGAEPLKKYPVWREALELFLSAGFADGDVIPHEWFRQAFELPEPAADEAMTWREAQERTQKLELELVANLEALRDELLTEYQRDLVNVRGVGYRIVPAAEQAQLAAAHLHEYMTKLFRKVASRQTHVRMHELNEETRRKTTQLQAHTSALRRFMLRERRNPFSVIEQKTLKKRDGGEKA